MDMRSNIRRGIRNSLKRHGKQHLRSISEQLLRGLDDCEWKQIYLEEIVKVIPDFSLEVK